MHSHQASSKLTLYCFQKEEILALLKVFVVFLPGEIPSIPRAVPQGVRLDSIEETSAFWKQRNWGPVYPSLSSLGLGTM